MWGKGALIAVLGFTMTFSIYKLNLSKAIFSTDEHISTHYMQTIVAQNAKSGLNMGIYKAWNEAWNTGNFTIAEDACTTIVSAATVGADSLQLMSKAWSYVFDEGHYAQTSQALKVQDSITALFAKETPISHYFWFTNNEGGVQDWNKWITTDTVSGPVHTNSAIYTYNSPVFNEKVTAYKGFSPDPVSSSSTANFYDGWEVGIEIPIPTDMTVLVAAAIIGNGLAPLNTKSIYNIDTSFEFFADGKVARIVGADPPDTVLVTDIAPTGVIYSANDVRVKGVFNGQLTIYTTDDIWFDDDLVYASDPTVNPGSDDILGLIARDEIIVTDNVANNSDCIIQACIFTWNDDFEAENYSTRPLAGELKITGSIVQKNRGRIGNFNATTGIITAGFTRNYQYDTRLITLSPPYYPTISHLRLLSWWE